MGNRMTVPSIERQLEQAVLGAQGLLVIAAVPSGAAGSLIGTNLVDAGALTVQGDYYCLIPMGGIVTEMEVYLNATFASGTVTSDAWTLYLVRDMTNPATWQNKSTFDDVGALATTVQQTFLYSGPRGERFASLKLTLAGGASATFTQAEYNGI